MFFVKQKTAYEIKECDWSSDVCSSDLKVYVVGEGVLEREYSMVSWIFCIDSWVERESDNKICEVAGETGFRTSEA